MRLQHRLQTIGVGVPAGRHNRSGALREIGVAGWVRNLPDGRVECVAAGTAAELARLRVVLEIGPPAARVSAVEEHPWDEPLEEHDFQIRR